MKTKHLYHLIGVFVAALLLFSCAPRTEQPEPIHYGPVQMVYELPQVSGVTYFVSPDGDPASEGTSIENPTTIEAAISRVVTGDAIVMRGGIYRTGNLTFNQGITIQPYRDEQPVINGTKVASEWEQVGDSIWGTNWQYLFPAGTEPWWVRERNERYTPMHRFNNDHVFIDGQYLQSAGSQEEVNAGTFFVDYANNRIYIGTNPGGRLVEITAFRKALFRTTGEAHGKVSDRRGPVIRGITFTQFPDTMVHIDGYYPQGISPEHLNGKDVVGTVLENNIFSNALRIGVFAIGDSLVMRNNLIYNTNTEGLYIVASNDVLLERNIFRMNNIERWTGFFPAAVKIFNQSHRVTCRENLVIDHPNSNGIWYDVGNMDGVFVNNWVENVGSPEGPFREDHIWPSKNGFFFEISKGVICAGNVFVNNNQGILVLNSSGARIFNNTMINSRVAFGRDDRGDDVDHFGWHIYTGPGVEERYGHSFVNNLMVFDYDYEYPLFKAWQQSDMCERLNLPQLEIMDHNVYVRRAPVGEQPIILWSPYANENCQTWLNSPAALTALHPGFEANSLSFQAFGEQIFVNEDNQDFRLVQGFPGIGAATALPGEVINALGLEDETVSFIGAFPVE